MQSPNQFAQTMEKGQLDLNRFSDVVTCRVSTSASASLVPGQAVTLADEAGKTISVIDGVSGPTVKAFGVVLRNLKQSEFAVNEMVEVAINGSVVYMEASEAIARGGLVAYSVTGEKVAEAVSTNEVLGIAMDKASADGDLIRVMLAPATVSQVVA